MTTTKDTSIPPGATHDEEIALRVSTGEPMASVGRDLGFSREHIRQRAAGMGITATSVRRARHAQVLDLARRGHSRNEIAHLTGYSRLTVDQILRRNGMAEAAIANDRVARRFRVRKTVEGSRLNYTDDELLDSLRAYATQNEGHPPSVAKWQAQGHKPTSPIFFRRFGSWDNALLSAGLQPNPQNRRHYDRVPDDAILAAVVAFLLDNGDWRKGPNAYQDWQSKSNLPGAVSIATVTLRFGSWSAVKRMAINHLQDTGQAP